MFDLLLIHSDCFPILSVVSYCSLTVYLIHIKMALLIDIYVAEMFLAEKGFTGNWKWYYNTVVLLTVTPWDNPFHMDISNNINKDNTDDWSLLLTTYKNCHTELGQMVHLSLLWFCTIQRCFRGSSNMEHYNTSFLWYHWYYEEDLLHFKGILWLQNFEFLYTHRRNAKEVYSEVCFMLLNGTYSQ